jgi:excisionase family DNA binding protein
MTPLTTTQAALILGVHRSRILHMIRDGQLASTKTGRDHFIDPRQLERVKDRKRGRPAKKSVI